MSHSIIKPRRPSGSGWVQGPAPDPQVTLGFEGETWFHRPSALYVISAVEVADRLVGLECACKDDEPAITEDKGDFIWRRVTR